MLGVLCLVIGGLLLIVNQVAGYVLLGVGVIFLVIPQAPPLSKAPSASCIPITRSKVGLSSPICGGASPLIVRVGDTIDHRQGPSFRSDRSISKSAGHRLRCVSIYADLRCVQGTAGTVREPRSSARTRP